MSAILAALLPVIKLVLEAIFGVVWEKVNEPTTVVDMARDPDRAARLRDRVRAHKAGTDPAG